MTTHITKTWFDGEKVVTQEIPESEVYKQEPVAWMYGCIGRGRMYAEELDDPAGWQPLYTTPPAAQPAVPDAFGTREGEHPQYIQGWNDCRAEILKARGNT